MKLENIELITPMGTMILDGELSGSAGNYSFEMDDFEFTDTVSNLIGGVFEASLLFFSDEIDLTNDTLEIDEETLEELFELLTQSKFDEPLKALAVHQHTGAEWSDIEENGENFEADGEEYLVITDEEADEQATQRAKDLIDDIGLEGFTEFAQDHAKEHFIDTDWFDEAMKESSESYCYDIKDESASDSDTYVSRLHEEMVEGGTMNEPEYPEEPEEDEYSHDREDFDSEDIDSEEPEEGDFDTEDEWQDAFDIWETKKEEAEGEWDEEQDRLETETQEEYDNAVEEWETEKEDYRSELENDVENNIDTFAESRIDGDDGYEWWTQNIGDATEVIKNNGLLDEDEFAEWLVETDGRGQYMSSYDGEENVETVTLAGETETFYLYRTS